MWDVGCRFGRSVRGLSEQYFQVIGTDISSQVIDKARELCQEIDNATFYVNEADSLPVEVLPSSIDMVYVFTVFQHIPREYTLVFRSVGKVRVPTNLRAIIAAIHE